MISAVDKLLYSVLQKNNLDECTVEELQRLADQYPYFAVAHVLLAAKLKDGDNKKYNLHFQKALLHFNNPFLLDQLITDSGNAELIPSVNEKSEEPMTNNIIEQTEITISSETASAQEEKKERAENDLAFEPYHTVDYFASQGIKIREEEQPKDRFGQQLKSFTDWLKTMKRLPAPEKIDEEKTVIERKVEELAEHSLEDREVVTETMAEVWEKQGDTQKAIDIYNKLSLQDPSKSSYFAARIEQLKNK